MKQSFAPIAIGALIAVVLQIALAPNIAVFFAVPNFLLAYVLVVAMLRPTTSVYVLAFALGLIFDLIGYGPVGVMAFLMTVSAYTLSRLFVVINNDTLFVPLLMLICSLFAVELAFGTFMLGFGVVGSPAEAFLYRALPCALYNCLIAVIMYLVAMRVIGSSSSKGKSAGQQSVNASLHPRVQSNPQVRVNRSKLRRK